MASTPQWLIREDASVPVLVALWLRQQLGVRAPLDLPGLRDVPPADAEESHAIEEQWLGYWNMTVEPQAHPASGPLELVGGFESLVALPVSGAEELREAIEPYAAEALAYARAAHDQYVRVMKGASGGSAYRAYASAIAEFEREVGRRAGSFELTVQVLPLSQRGVWWIGALTVAVTDSLRRDVVAFDEGIRPIIAELA